ncbi:hypothetical protein [Sphingomonas sp. Marseille-Q8236]
MGMWKNWAVAGIAAAVVMGPAAAQVKRAGEVVNSPAVLPVTLPNGTYITPGVFVQIDKTGTAIDATNPLPVTVILPQVTAISRSGIFGTTATQLMPANPTRRFIQVQVQNSATCYISGLSAATADQNSLLLPGGGQLFESSTHVTSGAISIICSAASTPVYAREG